MTNKRKKSIRDLATQFGVNRRAAASRLDQDRAPDPSGGMRPPLTLPLTPQFLDTYHAPVADLGVTQVRYTQNPKGEMDGLYFFVPAEVQYNQGKALTQRLRERWADNEIELVVIREGADGGDVVWSWSDEDAELRREVVRLGVHVVHERSGRWAARADDGRVEYGLTQGDACAKLIHAVWDDENVWQVDADTRAYVELQDDE